MLRPLSVTPWLRRVVLGLALVLAAYSMYRFRVAWMARLFVRGDGVPAKPVLAGVEGAAPAGPGVSEMVRVVLIDGVDRRTARGMPGWSAICDQGLDLVVDTGFPTVSLPVQRVLWTGLTQQQSGVLFVGGPIERPIQSIPLQVGGSVAVAESHQGIVHSLGFDEAYPADKRKVPDDWGLEATWRSWLDIEGAHGFVRAARDWVTSDRQLVFVHILVTDSVAHRAGRESAGFRAAAAWADRLLAELYAEERAVHPTGTRWFVLADHGHRAGGGHGDAEPYIRQVRGCIQGDGITPGTLAPAGYVHLVDFSRAIADSVGAALPAEAAGRPLPVALAAPVDETATLPRPGPRRWAAALILLLAALVATGFAARGRLTALPLWWPVAYLALIWIELPPSLTTHMVYKPWGEIIWKAALPGLCLLAICAPLALRALSPARVIVAQLAVPLAIAIGGLILTGGAALGLAGEPPLIPLWTGRTSVFLVLAATGVLVVALAVLASSVPSGSGRSSAAGTRRRSP